MTTIKAHKLNERNRKEKLVKQLLKEGFSLQAIAAALKLTFAMASSLAQGSLYVHSGRSSDE